MTDTQTAADSGFFEHGNRERRQPDRSIDRRVPALAERCEPTVVRERTWHCHNLVVVLKEEQFQFFAPLLRYTRYTLTVNEKLQQIRWVERWFPDKSAHVPCTVTLCTDGGDLALYWDRVFHGDDRPSDESLATVFWCEHLLTLGFEQTAPDDQ